MPARLQAAVCLAGETVRHSVASHLVALTACSAVTGLTLPLLWMAVHRVLALVPIENASCTCSCPKATVHLAKFCC